MKTSYQGSMEKAAKAIGLNLSISKKVGYEVSNAIRGKDVKRAVTFLENVMLKSEAVPYKRYNFDTGHKPGKVGPGRYPFKAAKGFLYVLNNAIANAKDKGLNVNNLKIVHVTATHGNHAYRYGRNGGTQKKTAHVDIVVQEYEQKAPKQAKAEKVKAEVTNAEKPKVTKEVSSEDSKKKESKKEIPVEKNDEKVNE
jgi:ribosomal protein uL22